MNCRNTLFAAMVLVVVATMGLTRPREPEKMQTGFLFQSIEAQGRVYDYSVYVPRDYDGSRALPLLLFLHGRGESGTDGQRQMTIGVTPRVIYERSRWPFIILYPQKPDQESQWEDHLEAVKAMLDRAQREYQIDDSRMYLTGLSQGGHGTWMFNALIPDTFAAIAPVCGYGQAPTSYTANDRGWSTDPETETARLIVDAAKRVPVWAFHGTADGSVPASQTEFLVEQIRQAGGDAQITLYEGVGHNSWEKAYADPELPKWLLEQRLRR